MAASEYSQEFPSSLAECSGELLLFLLNNSMNDDDKIEPYKEKIISYMKDNNINGQTLLTVQRREFAENVIKHCGDKKIRMAAIKVYDTLNKLSFNGDEQKEEKDDKIDNHDHPLYVPLSPILFNINQAPQFGFTVTNYTFLQNTFIEFNVNNIDLAALQGKLSLINETNSEILSSFPESNASVIAGFSPSLWNALNDKNNRIPFIRKSDSILNKHPDHFTYNYSPDNNKYYLWLLSRSKTADNKLQKALLTLEDAFCGGSESSDTLNGKIINKYISYSPYSGQILDTMQDGYSNATSKVKLDSHIINDDGNCWALFQLFNVNHSYHNQTDIEMQTMFGRTRQGEIVGNFPSCAHNRKQRIINPFTKLPIELFRIHGTSINDGAFVEPLNDTPEKITFISYANKQENIEQHLGKMVDSENTKDKLLNFIQGTDGGYFFIPGAKQLYTLSKKQNIDDIVYEKEFARPKDLVFGDDRSENKLMFFNARRYLYSMSKAHDNESKIQEYMEGDPPSYRILNLFSNTIDRWKNCWYFLRYNPELPSLTDCLSFIKNNKNDTTEYKKYNEKNNKQNLSIMIRKGLASKITLGYIYTNNKYNLMKKLEIIDHNKTHYMDIDNINSDEKVSEFEEKSCKIAAATDTFRIDPYDLIAGTMPDFTLGRGKRCMPYIYDGMERQSSFEARVSEDGAGGHVVPGYESLIKNGLPYYIELLSDKMNNAETEKKKEFYESCLLSLEGVKIWLENHAKLARDIANDSDNDLNHFEKENLLNLSQICTNITIKNPQTFHEGIQLLFGMHCCMHLIGELNSIGRIDQILLDLYSHDIKNNKLTKDIAQDLIDAFWLKVCDKALLNNEKVQDQHTYGTGCITGRAGNFDQGGGINQWVQQIVCGPHKNDIMLMCLKASRRLPLNAPCLCIRLNDDVDNEVLNSITNSILSGGAHPVLYHEQRMIKALTDSGLKKEDAMNYVTDGCYEAIISGSTQWWFMYLWPIFAMDYTLNEGAEIMSGGDSRLKGNKMSLVTKEASKIKTFEEFMDIFYQHFTILAIDAFTNSFSSYMNVKNWCPSPLLSVFTENCIENGRDFTDGGARIKLFGIFLQTLPLLIDSLYCIKEMVFDKEDNLGFRFKDLGELRDCLQCDWGYNMKEPIVHSASRRININDDHDIDVIERSQRWKRLREEALKHNKFGKSFPANNKHTNVDQLGHDLITNMLKILNDIKQNPSSYSYRLDNILNDIKKVYGSEWDYTLMPGCGNFEGFVGSGRMYGATADGRRNGQSCSSDLSPQTIPDDLESIPQELTKPIGIIPESNYNRLFSVLYSWNADCINYGLSDGSAVDINIREDFDKNNLKKLLKEWCKKDSMFGANFISLTCCNPSTYKKAYNSTDSCDLLRVRQGGWTEFFTVLFDAHKKQHQRRLYFIPVPDLKALRDAYDVTNKHSKINK